MIYFLIFFIFGVGGSVCVTAAMGSLLFFSENVCFFSDLGVQNDVGYFFSDFVKNGFRAVEGFKNDVCYFF